MNKKTILSMLGALALLASCSEQSLVEQNIESGNPREITISASVPPTDPSLRIALDVIEGQLDLQPKFQASEKIRLIAVQNNKAINLGMVTPSNISGDSKRCELSIKLPATVDSSKPYDIIGVAGDYNNDRRLVIPADGSSIPLNLTPYTRIKNGAFTPPIYFRAKNVTDPQNISAVFQNIGCYEIIHIKNSSKSTIAPEAGLYELGGGDY